ncbi:MAG: carbon storage regulator [Planctomycetaceae bacterium]|nr:carbon storage regulator [Planctomycetaceae bacterium]
MLVLSRRCDEEIVIDDQVHVKVLSMSGDRVRIGVTAPSDVVIRRADALDGRVLDCGPVLIADGEAVA